MLYYIKLNQIRDTLIESQLYNPIRDGGHSLESWGERLNYNKGNFTEFSEYSDNMLEYCKRDVELTRRLSVKLQEEGKNFSSQAYEIERKVRSIVDKQQQNGFALNIKEAMLLQAELLDEQYNLERQADETFPPKEIQLKTKVKYVPFNIASRKQIAERLIEKGWKPDKHTDKGNIIVSEEVLSKIKDIPEAEMFSRYHSGFHKSE